MRRLRSIPPPLAVLLALAAVLTVAWSLLLPELQGPDETGHVAYVQRIAEAGEIPFDPGRGNGDRGIDTASSELRTAARWAGLEQLRANPAARPAWTGADEALWRAHDRRLGPAAGADGTFNAAFRNPPLYYLYATPFYLAASSGSIFDRMWALRLANLPLVLALVALVWGLTGELLGPAAGPRFLAAALVALQPGVTNLEGTVNPDLMLLMFWTAGLLLMTRLVRRGPTVARAAALVAVLAGAGLTNGRGLLMIVPAVVAALAAWRRHGSVRLRTWVISAAAAAAAAVAGFLVVLTQPITTPFVTSRPGGFLSYVWQFYLPRLPGMKPAPGPDYGVRDAFVARVWGGYAQLEIGLPGWAVSLLLALSVLFAVGLAVALWRRPGRLDAGVLAVCVAAIVGLLAGLHLIAYRSLLSNPADPVIAGRYVLVLAGLAAAAVAAVVWSLPRRWMVPALGVILAGAVVVQVNALGLLVERFWS